MKEAVQNCLLKARFKNSVAVKVSAPEEHDSAEAIEKALFVARMLGYGKELDQASLEEAWRCLKSERVVPAAVALQGFLYANFFITATEQMMHNSIMQDVLGNLQQGPGSDVKDGETPCSFKVLDAVDVLQHCASSIELQDAMQSVWAC